MSDAVNKPFSVANIDNALVDIYTCPIGSTAIVYGLILCNISGATINVDVTFLDSSAGITTYLCFNQPILAGQSMIVLGDPVKQAMEASDKIRARATAGSNVLDITGSVLEQAI